MENSGSPSKFILRRRFLHNGSPTEEFLKIKIYGRFRRLLYIILYRCTPPKASPSVAISMHLNNSHNPLRPKKDRNFDPFSSKELWVLLFLKLYGLPLYQIYANKRTYALQTRNEITTNIKLSNLFKIATSSHASPLPNVSLSYRVGYISHVMSIIPCNEHRSDFHASKFLFLII